MADAGTLRCPNCGAPAPTDSARCPHCTSVLMKAACPSCLGRIFAGMPHCPHCGAATARKDLEADSKQSCPRCREPLGSAAVGELLLRECAQCGGIWLGKETFEALCADREKQAAVLVASTPAAGPAPEPIETIRYVPCPACTKLMVRRRFASGAHVVVDVCGPHGVWFDRDELRQIVEFIRSGGLDRARAHEMAELKNERMAVGRARAGGGGGGGMGSILGADASSAQVGMDAVDVIGCLVRFVGSILR